MNALFDLGLDRIWETMTDWIPPQLLTPEFIGWVGIVAAVIVVTWAIGYFLPMTRSLVGAVSLAAVALLVGMWKGIGYQAARQKQREKTAQAPKPEPVTFKLPWQR